MTGIQRYGIAAVSCLTLLIFVLPRVTIAVPPAVLGTITEFTVPTADSFPAGITEGPDGNLWFVENTGNNLASFNPQTHEFREYRIPAPGSFSVRVVADSDGNLWFTESAGNHIGEFTIATGTFHEYRIPTAGASPFEIVLSDTGIWFTEQGTGKIGNVSNGVVTEYSTHAPNSDPVGIVPGTDGAIWFTELAGQRVVRFDPPTQTFTDYYVPDGEPFEIERGPDGAFWFTIEERPGIGRITNAGEITRFAIPTLAADPMTLRWARTAHFGLTKARRTRSGGSRRMGA
jgi:virginiamycin B lyase